MVFKRRTPRTWLRTIAESFYPRGGWSRAGRYVMHRLRRLPDPAHKISRGIAAGVFTSFTPFFGLHFICAALVAWIMRGNILAAMLATFIGNPLTFPLIGAVAVETGSWMLGLPHMPVAQIFSAFGQAWGEIWSNVFALFVGAPTNWSALSGFYFRVFLPYLVGGIIPGVVAALLAYYLSNPIIASYQRGRIRSLKERFEKRRRALEAAKAARKAERE